MVKQYVGARYVPKLASPIEWAAGTSYEALTIVTFNNASYTSKVPVPPTVGNPAGNPDYWALTGNYNAQVEQYRQETIQFKNEITEDQNALKNELNLYKAGRKRKFMLFGDSYGRGTDGDNNTSIVSGGGWAVRFKTLMESYGIECIHCTEASGFNAESGQHCIDTFNNYISGMSEQEIGDVTDVVFIGGWNDQWSTSGLTSAVIAFIQRVKAVMPRAEILIAPMTCNPVQGMTIYGYYADARGYGARITPDLVNVLAKKSFTGADGIHPTAAGYTAIQPYITEFILAGKTNYSWYSINHYENSGEKIQLAVRAEAGKTIIAPMSDNRGGCVMTKNVTEISRNYEITDANYIQVGSTYITMGNCKIFHADGTFHNIFGWYFTDEKTIATYGSLSAVIGDTVVFDTVLPYYQEKTI